MPICKGTLESKYLWFISDAAFSLNKIIIITSDVYKKAFEMKINIPIKWNSYLFRTHFGKKNNMTVGRLFFIS